MVNEVITSNHILELGWRFELARHNRRYPIGHTPILANFGCPVFPSTPKLVREGGANPPHSDSVFGCRPRKETTDDSNDTAATRPHRHTRPGLTPPVNGPTPYRIQLRGRLSDAILAPYVHEFVVSRTTDSTVLAGDVRDPAHLHGIITHLTGLGIELISVTSGNPAQLEPDP